MTVDQYLKIKDREKVYRARLLKINPYLTDNSGIYFFTRTDENGIKYGYVGQARHVLTRLAQHLDGYEQHIDLSIRKHGLYSEDNQYGWMITFDEVPVEELDQAEQRYIKTYADLGYQLRNKTSGSQGKGKRGIADNKTAKGYYDGKKQGRNDVLKELKQTLKYIEITPVNDGKLANRMLAKFWEILGE